MASMATPLRVGLVGAGPWATIAHAPLLAAGPATELAGVWARRPEAATELAGRHGAVAFDRLEQLFDACDAVAFAVPPDVQADLAARAARAGKAVLLEKPLATSLTLARRLADAVLSSGVGSLMFLTWRYAPAVRSFLAEAAGGTWFGGRVRFVSGGLLGGSVFATPWRLEHGPLLDLGPHVVDLIDAALGRVVSVRTANGDPHGLVHLALDHEGGAASVASVCGTCPLQPSVAGAELFGPSGSLEVDCNAVRATAFARIAEELAVAARDRRHPLDVRRGLQIQEVLEAARTALGERRTA